MERGGAVTGSLGRLGDPKAADYAQSSSTLRKKYFDLWS
jgi:hypothetical protein